uniref:(northern house mosquito) hypothetical protein n=1 Tax=Culex pipiens TaxID=7175 RepID=A0A8D8IPK4_CULPI
MHANEMVATFERGSPGCVRLAVRILLFAECGRTRSRRSRFHLLSVAERCLAVGLVVRRRRVLVLLGLVLHHFGIESGDAVLGGFQRCMFSGRVYAVRSSSGHVLDLGEYLEF